jgi:hypothetical protein
MRRRNRAWVLLPAVLLTLAVVGVLVSSFQVELGLMRPGKGERAAVAAMAEARDLSVGADPEDYSAFGHSLLVAVVAQKNAAPTNAADARVDNLLARALDCLQALREAWQADLEGLWDPQAYGAATYWNGLHPGLDLSAGRLLTPETLRDAARVRASEWIGRALELVD